MLKIGVLVRSFPLVVGLLFLFAGAGLGLNAQDNLTETIFNRSFNSVLEVNLFNVEMIVTDKKGKPVTGLKASDFKLFVDDKPIDFDYFQEISGSPPSTPRQNPPPLANSLFSGNVVRADKGNSYLVFIDDYFVERKVRRGLLKRLINDIEGLRPQDRMAIIRYRGERLEVLTSWTGDQNALSYIVQEISNQSSGELDRQRKINAVFDLDHKLRILDRQIQQVTNAVAISMRSFSNPPGRRIMVIVSSGWPYDIVKYIQPSSAQLLRTTQKYRSLTNLETVTDMANMLGYTIYPLHQGQKEPYNQIWVESLDFLAEQTGGKLISYAITHKHPFHKVMEDLEYYYRMSFTLHDDKQDERKSVRVELADKELKLRHRKDLTHLTRDKQLSMKTEAAFLLEQEGDPLEVDLGTPLTAPKRRLEVPVSLKIPMDQVVMESIDGQYQAELELRIVALDETGNRSDMPLIPVRITGSRPTPGHFSTFKTRILVRNSRHKLVFTLYDPLSGMLLSTTTEMNP